MDSNLRYFEIYLEKKVVDNTYDPTPEENTAIYCIENDPMYADLANSIKGIESYDIQLETVKKYIKDAAFNNESLDMDESLDNEKKDELENIIMKYKEQYGIQDDLSIIKSNLGSFINDPTRIEYLPDEQTKEFYYKCYDEYVGEKKDKLDKDKAVTKSMSLTNPDLNNHGYVNLLFMAIVLTVIAFIVLFKIF